MKKTLLVSFVFLSFSLIKGVHADYEFYDQALGEAKKAHREVKAQVETDVSAATTDAEKAAARAPIDESADALVAEYEAAGERLTQEVEAEIAQAEDADELLSAQQKAAALQEQIDENRAKHEAEYIEYYNDDEDYYDPNDNSAVELGMEYEREAAQSDVDAAQAEYEEMLYGDEPYTDEELAAAEAKLADAESDLADAEAAEDAYYNGDTDDIYMEGGEAVPAGTAEAVEVAPVEETKGPVFSGGGLTGGISAVEASLTNSVSKETDIKSLIIAWTNFLLPLAATVAVLAVVWAGFLYITAFGDDGRVDTAKKIITWVVIGLLVIAAAYAIVNWVMTATF